MKLWMMLFFSCQIVFAQKILIDPGHGGKYEGVTSLSGKIVEKNLTLCVALKLEKILKKEGHTVTLTRRTDCELNKKNLIKDLECRAAMTESTGADFFISIHFNGSHDARQRGFEVYVPYTQNFPKKSYYLANLVHHELAQKNNKFNGGSLGNLNSRDSGIKASRFVVLTKATCPAVLVEFEFLTNANAEKELSSDEHCEQLAQSLADAIKSYCKKNKN